MTTLQKTIEHSICDYPSLFRCKGNPKLSRLLAMEHIFFVIGNGYEWDRDRGILICVDDSAEPVELPENYFDMDLFTFDVKENDLDEFKEMLLSKGKYFHICDRYIREPVTVHFEATEKEILELQPRWDNDRFGINKFTTYIKLAETKRNDLSLYPLGQYSAIVELTAGRTNSFHIENYSFSEYPVQQDWIDGCVELATEALAYYNDESRCSADPNHPSRILLHEKSSYDEAKTSGKLKEYRLDHQYNKGETVEGWCLRRWDKYRNEQKDYLQAFMARYPNWQRNGT